MRLCRHSFFLIQRKKNNQEISLNLRNFSLTVKQCTNWFDSKKFLLNQRKFYQGLSHITYVLYATVQTFIFFNLKEKNNQEISLNLRNFSLTVYQCTNWFDSKKFWLNQRNFFLGVGSISAMKKLLHGKQK